MGSAVSQGEDQGMHHHRFSEQLSQAVGSTPALEPGQGFVACPHALLQGLASGCPWQHVYQLAYEQARAVVAPSRLERYQRHNPN
jgi:hypothetical protein